MVWIIGNAGMMGATVNLWGDGSGQVGAGRSLWSQAKGQMEGGFFFEVKECGGVDPPQSLRWLGEVIGKHAVLVSQSITHSGFTYSCPMRSLPLSKCL